jgi:hypothetical protein
VVIAAALASINVAGLKSCWNAVTTSGGGCGARASAGTHAAVASTTQLSPTTLIDRRIRAA